MYPPQGPPQYAGGGNPGQWTTGLCDCTEDPSNCFITCCCPCITFGQSAGIIDNGTTTCAMAGLLYVLLACDGCGCIYSCRYRTKLRAMYSLPEEPCADFCVHCWCTACATCQEFRELKNRGYDPAIGWIVNAEKMTRVGSTVPPNVAPGMHRYDHYRPF